MNLKDAILNSEDYNDSDDVIHMVFVKKINEHFESISETVILGLTYEEMEMNLTDIQNSKCPGFEYFLEMNIIQDFMEDMRNNPGYASDDRKVERLIHYAEFDA